jgi:hypothetical protein
MTDANGNRVLPTQAESLTLLPDNVTQQVNPFHGAGYHGNTEAAKVVANWHDDHHPGAFAFCDLQPCDAVRRVEW